MIAIAIIAVLLFLLGLFAVIAGILFGFSGRKKKEEYYVEEGVSYEEENEDRGIDIVDLGDCADCHHDDTGVISYIPVRRHDRTH